MKNNNSFVSDKCYKMIFNITIKNKKKQTNLNKRNEIKRYKKMQRSTTDFLISLADHIHMLEGLGDAHFVTLDILKAFD